MIKEQLEKSGLFKVDLQSTEWVTYSKARTADAYPVYQLGWFPDYSDADNYLTPFFIPGNFLKNHYENPAVTDIIKKQLVTVDKTERETSLGDAQTAVAKDLSTLPLLQGAQLMVAGADVKGVEQTLDPSFKTRLGVISK
jgi:peptide/nickel transport system substrate-binding protein